MVPTPSAADIALPGLAARDLEDRARRASALLRGRLEKLERRLGASFTTDERRFTDDAAREVEHLLARVDLHIAIARARASDELVELDPVLHRFLVALGAESGAGGAATLRP